jgi:formate hydrogenlyase subunit 6/NADH:ubiquinone oxidoreductase subunit I
MSHSITTTCNGCTACVKLCPVAAITGARGKLHAINPAACVDCAACGHVCPVEAVKNGKGITVRMLKRSLWLKPVVTAEHCVSCGACIETCPTGVMAYAELVDHQVRHIATLVDAKNCIGCSFCAHACPTEAIAMKN